MMDFFLLGNTPLHLAVLLGHKGKFQIVNCACQYEGDGFSQALAFGICTKKLFYKVVRNITLDKQEFSRLNHLDS